MRGSFKLGQLFGIRIRVHWLFLVLLGYFLLFGGGLSAAVLLICVFACVVLHELGHSLVARRYGVGVRDITLLPIGGVAQLESLPEDPRAELRIAAAGPAVNLALAALFLLLAAATGAGQVVLGVDALGSLAAFLGTLLAINVSLAAFNLLPGFPMDGGRLLRAWLARRMGMVRATALAARVGRWMAFAMGLVGLALLHPILIFIAVFIYLAGTQEEAAVRMRHRGVRSVELNPFYGLRIREGDGEPRALTSRELDELEAELRRLLHQHSRMPWR
ncbi:MAG: site-2 protease family protein [Candidatus Brocadiia bacterium]